MKIIKVGNGVSKVGNGVSKVVSLLDLIDEMYDSVFDKVKKDEGSVGETVRTWKSEHGYKENRGDTDGDTCKCSREFAKQCSTCVHRNICKYTMEASYNESLINNKNTEYPKVFKFYYDCNLYELDSKEAKEQMKTNTVKK